MKSIPCYTADKYVEVNFNGNTYPLIFNMQIAEEIQRKYGDIDVMTKEMSSAPGLACIAVVFFSAAVKVAAFYGRKLPEITAEEIEFTANIREQADIKNAIYSAILKATPTRAQTDTDSEFSDDEKQEIVGAPKPDSEEKNK